MPAGRRAPDVRAAGHGPAAGGRPERPRVHAGRCMRRQPAEAVLPDADDGQLADACSQMFSRKERSLAEVAFILSASHSLQIQGLSDGLECSSRRIL